MMFLMYTLGWLLIVLVSCWEIRKEREQTERWKSLAEYRSFLVRGWENEYEKLMQDRQNAYRVDLVGTKEHLVSIAPYEGTR